jgi:hypothetical protein
MAHWAELDSDNTVLRVLVTDNNDPNGDEGYQWLIDNLGGTWVQTSYNANFGGKYAGIGDTWDGTNFISNAPVLAFPTPALNNDEIDYELPGEGGEVPSAQNQPILFTPEQLEILAPLNESLNNAETDEERLEIKEQINETIKSFINN